MDPSLIAILGSILLAIMAWLRESLRPKRPTLSEALERIRIRGLSFDSERTNSIDGSDFPPEAQLLKAWLINEDMSLKYWRTFKQGHILETLDFVFTDRPGAGGHIIHFVNGKPTGRKDPATGALFPLNAAGSFLASQILEEVRVCIPERRVN